MRVTYLEMVVVVVVVVKGEKKGYISIRVWVCGWRMLTHFKVEGYYEEGEYTVGVFK